MGPVWAEGTRGAALATLGGTAAVLWVLNRARGSFWLLSLLALPGTCCHELAHWLVGLVLGARPARLTLWPRRVAGGVVLGSVTFRNLRWYNAFFVGVAPLALLPAAWGLFLLRLGAGPRLDWREAGVVFLLGNLVFAALPSWQDLRIAARSPVGWLLLAAGAAWLGMRG